MTTDLLARPGLDFGLPTDNGIEMEAFYGEELGLELLSKDLIIEGEWEAFYVVHGSWVKLNPSDNLNMEPAVSGYRELLYADDSVSEPKTVRDPDGTPITRVPKGHRGIEEVGLVVVVNDLESHRRFLLEGMDAVDLGGDAFRVGNTVMFVEQSPTPIEPTPIIRRGLTMITLIVSDLIVAHQRLIDAGGRHGMRASNDPGQPGRCLFSLVSDPTGNWIELVQFAGEGGRLPELDEPDPTVDDLVAFRDQGVTA